MYIIRIITINDDPSLPGCATATCYYSSSLGRSKLM